MERNEAFNGVVRQNFGFWNSIKSRFVPENWKSINATFVEAILANPIIVNGRKTLSESNFFIKQKTEIQLSVHGQSTIILQTLLSIKCM